jgi:hypothetical protein
MAAIARPLDYIITTVTTYLAAKGDTAVHGEGWEHVNEHKEPPSYSWIPGRDLPADVTGRCDPSEEQRAVTWAWTEEFSVRCWGTTRNDAYRLRNNLLNAIRASFGRAVVSRPSGFLDPSQRGTTERGFVYVLGLAVETNTIEGYDGEVDFTVEEITAVERTAQIILPSGTETVFGPG